jgi:hypothetical protein
MIQLTKIVADSENPAALAGAYRVEVISTDQDTRKIVAPPAPVHVAVFDRSY